MLKAILPVFLLAILVSGAVPTAAEDMSDGIHCPKTIMQKIAGMLEECPSEQQRPLGSEHFIALDPNTLLILLELPDYLCAKSNSIVPLLADIRGRWILGDLLPGAPAFFGKGPDNTLWLVTQWQIEGTYPSLFRSKDGLHWQEIQLPPGPEPGSPFIFLSDLRFLGKDLLITLASENGDENRPAQSYSANLRQISSGEAVWQEYSDNGINMPAGCEPARMDVSAWTRKESPETREIVFHRNRIKLILPADLSRP